MTGLTEQRRENDSEQYSVRGDNYCPIRSLRRWYMFGAVFDQLGASLLVRVRQATLSTGSYTCTCQRRRISNRTTAQALATFSEFL